MKARKETRGHNPGQEVLALMDWTIFITTIPAEKLDFESILALYGLRWRIEIIFKGQWKSHLHFATLHRVSKTQLHILISARLLVNHRADQHPLQTLRSSVVETVGTPTRSAQVP